MDVAIRCARPLIHRASAAVIHAARALAARPRTGGVALRVRREPRQLLLQLGGMALRALGLLLAEDDSFELVTALSADVFENRHGRSCYLSPGAAFAIMEEVSLVLSL